jgi:hypothetical protein
MSSPFRQHRGHDLELVTYGAANAPENVAAECLDCNEVMIDYDLDTPNTAADLLLAHEPHALIDITPQGALRCGCGDLIAEAND